MSDGSKGGAAGAVAPAGVPIGSTAGALLKRAREAQGLDLAALAAAMKVAPRKLELLEADRFDELHDATFARALAQSVCRSLRVDATPVMALLPQVQGPGLDHINQGLNTPFRERPAGVLSRDWSVLARPVVWAPTLLVLAAAALYFSPADWFGAGRASVPVETAVAPAPVVPASAVPATVVETVYSAPAQPEAPSDSASAVATVSGLLQLRTTAQSWVEVLDARGQMLLSRVILPGETVGLDGALPLRVKIGNSAGTQVVFRGEPVELTPFSRENVARLELK
jgi:cytoskeleton protein RodZ